MRCGKPYKIEGYPFFYFHCKEENGVRKRVSTGVSNYEDAIRFIEKYKRQNTLPVVPTLRLELQKYASVDTNPKYRRSKIDGSSYTEEYAYKVANASKHIEKILDKHCPALLEYRLDEVSRRDAKEIVEYIVLEKGLRRTSCFYQQVCKVLFTEAWQDGIINASPFFQQRRINYKEKEMYSIPNEWIAWVVTQQGLFVDYQFWAYFTLLALTGMRRNELLGLNRSQVFGSILTIDRQVKGKGSKQREEDPKCHIKRSIPLCQRAVDILDSLPIGINGRYFNQPEAWIYQGFEYLKAGLNQKDKEHEELWQDMTPHTLRRSFNTNCTVAGVNDALVSEYCGWEHQKAHNDMQKRYTKFRVSHLKAVADCVDEIYQYQEGMLEALVN